MFDLLELFEAFKVFTVSAHVENVGFILDDGFMNCIIEGKDTKDLSLEIYSMKVKFQRSY